MSIHNICCYEEARLFITFVIMKGQLMIFVIVKSQLIIFVIMKSNFRIFVIMTSKLKSYKKYEVCL